MATYGKSSTNKNTANISESKNNKSLLNSNIRINPNSFKVKQKELLIFFRQLSVILKSGVPLAQGISLLAENTKNKKLSILLMRISSQLSAGEELSNCLRKYPKLFPPITVGLIEAGEAGGILDKVLERIAKLIEERDKIKGQIVGALIYPGVVLTLAVTVSLALLIFIVPRFEDMFKSIGGDLPGLTKFMLLLSRGVTSPYFLIVGPISIFIITIVFNSFYKTTVGRVTIDSLILDIPLFGDLLLKSEVASLSDTLSTLIDSGIPLIEGLERCIYASSNQVMKNTISKSIRMIREGSGLSYTLDGSKVIPRLVTSMIKIGEETGQLGFMLENLSMFYKRELESTVSAITKAMEPAIVIVVSLIVGTIVIALYLPMFSLVTQVGQ